MPASDLNNRAVHLYQRHTQQVVGRHPILQAMRPARIHCNVARNRTSQLAGGIGGVEKAVRLNRAGHA